MTRGRGRGRGGRAPQPTVQQQMKAMERRLNRRMMGHTYVPSMEPTTFTQKPWNSWTFERTDTTTGTLQGIGITVADVTGQIKGKNGLAGAAVNIVIKVQSAAIWCTAGETIVQPDVECKFYELNEKTVTPQQPRSIQRDLGTLNRPAKCGYVWPVADSKEIIYSAEDALILCVGTATTTGSKVTFRIHVLWQFEE